MSNYKETTATGTSWQRCNRIEIENTYNDVPAVRFWEETVYQFGDQTLKRPAAGLYVPMLPDVAIPIIDPETNTPTGTYTSHTQLYVLLYSTYIYHALKRDADIAAATGV